MMVLGGGMLLAALATARAGEVPPGGSQPLSEVIKSVEAQKSGVITEVDFDDGFWQVEIHKGGKEVTLYLDPKTGKTDRRVANTDVHEELPPGDGKPLSEIIKGVEDQKLGVITEVEFDNGFWEVEVRKDGKKSRLKVHPKTGEQRAK
jgi:hypothetical protein